MAGSQAMNQGSALVLPMAAPALWNIWSASYMVASPALFDCATSLLVHKCPLFYGKGCDSDHKPLSLNLQLPWQHVSLATSESRADICRFKHDASKCTQYCQHLQQQIAQCTTQMSDTCNADMAV